MSPSPDGGLRIAFLAWRDLPNPQAGGSEVVVDNLARGFLARGHAVTLLAGGPIGAHPYPTWSTGGTYSQYARAPVEFWRHARDVDVVVDVENGVPFFSPLWQRKPLVCLVHHVHTDQWGMHFPAPVAAVGRWLEGTAMPRVYRRVPFVADSSSTARALVELGIGADRITTIELGFDPVEIVGPRAPEPRFLVLGRLVPHKRVERALELWPRVRAKTGGELVIVGDGPERERLRALAGDGVTFAGSVSDAEKGRELGAAWLLVHPAHHEGWGVVIIEAAAAGVPTVAYDVEGVRDAVVDGETGILAADDDAFVDAWVQLATDDARRARMAEACVARAAMFTWDATVERFETVVREAVARTRGVNAVDRYVELWRLFRAERENPGPFYRRLAADAVAGFERRYGSLGGKVLADVGCGPGYYTEAFRGAGAAVLPIDGNASELHLAGDAPPGAVLGDAERLPVRTGSLDGVFCSNMLEHTPRPGAVIDEMARVLRPGGWGYLSFTNWYSPWGGHEMSPYHMLGPERGPAAYERRHGPDHKHHVGENLYPVHVGDTIRRFDAHPQLHTTRVEPRYWPWAAVIAQVPGVREVFMWNCVIRFERL